MTNISDDYLRQLWQQQPVDRKALTFEAVEKKVAMLQSADRSRKVVGALATAVGAAMFALNLTGIYMWGGSILRGSIISGVLFLSCAWSFWSTLRRLPAVPDNADRDIVGFVDYAIAAHERAMNVGISLSHRRFVVPSVLASLACIYLAWSIAPDDSAMAGFIIAWVALAQYLAHKGRTILRKQADFLGALRDSIRQSE